MMGIKKKADRTQIEMLSCIKFRAYISTLPVSRSIKNKCKYFFFHYSAHPFLNIVYKKR